MAKSTIKSAAEKIRKISAEIMADVATFLPQDGFKLSADMLGKEYAVVDVLHSEFLGRKTFTVVLANDERTINISAGLLKRARVLGATNVVAKAFDGHQGVVLRSDADAIWAASKYYHSTGEGMKKDDSFTLPEKMTLEFAVLKEDATNPGKPALNPFLYKGYRKVVESYQKRDAFPTMDDFRAELQKSGADRIAGLSVETVPTPFEYVKTNDPANMGFVLIFKDIAD